MFTIDSTTCPITRLFLAKDNQGVTLEANSEEASIFSLDSDNNLVIKNEKLEASTFTVFLVAETNGKVQAA
jgi:ureidoglycolate hydrolase